MFYQVEPLFPGLTRIWDVARTAMYLVEGADRTVLIDTGVGLKGLKELVDGLTDKPLTILLTHGHVDHAMGAGLFPGVPAHIGLADEMIYAEHSVLGVRRGYVMGAAMQGGDPAVIASVADDDFAAPVSFSEFLPLMPGDRFELGGVSLEIMTGRGHTPGSVTVLIPEWRLLLLGDACNAFTYLFAPECPTVPVYKETLLKLKAETDGKYERTLFSHGVGEGAPDMIDRVIAVCDDIMAGKVDNMPFRGFSGEPVCIAKAMDFSRFCRADGGEGNIVYDPNK